MSDRPPDVQRTPTAVLVHQYVQTRSEIAFGEIVSRHASLVFGVAFRRLRDRHLAEDVTQSVFLILSRKAMALRRETVLAAWLVKVTLYEASQADRRERRRREHEKKAMRQSSIPEQASDLSIPENQQQWVDQALSHLSTRERRAVMLRYLDGLTNSQAACVLGISENSCKQRVFRGLERMRKFLSKHGITTSGAVIGAAIPPMVGMTHPIRSDLIDSITKFVHTASSAPLTKGTLLVMATQKAKVVTTAVITLLLAFGGLAVRARLSRSLAPRTSGADASVAQLAPIPETISHSSAIQSERSQELVQRQVSAPDGQTIVVVSPRSGRAAGPSPGYTVVGKLDDQVNTRSQHAKARWLRRVAEKLVADATYAGHFKATTDQLDRLSQTLRDKPEAGQERDPGGDVDQQFVLAIQSILTPPQLQQLNAKTLASDPFSGEHP